LLGVVHHLQYDAPLPGQANASLPQRLLQSSRCFRGIKSLAGGSPVLRRYRHSFSGACLAN
jgi:hypothetical protein